MEIRAALDAEGDAIGALTEAAYRADGYLDDDTGNLAGLLRDGSRRIREATVLVAVQAADLGGDDLVGTITLTVPGERWAEVSRPGELEIRLLAVSPGHRRQGIAEVLLRAAEYHARDRGLHRMVLCTGTTMHGAQRLYEHLGFERLPERDWTPVPGIELISYGHPVGVDGPSGPRG